MAVSSPQNKKNRTKGNRNSYVVGRFGIIFAITVFIAHPPPGIKNKSQ